MDGAQPVLPRSGRFNRAPLVQLLADGGIAQAGAQASAHASAQPLSFAQRWSPWLAWTDAIALSAVLADGLNTDPGSVQAGVPPLPLAGLPAPARQVITDSQRLRQDLAQAIHREPMFQPSAVADADATAPSADDLAALRRQHRQHQQAMDDRIAPLRARLRAVMAGVSPALSRLAALDGVLEPSLSARQRPLLAAVPAWLAQSAAQRPGVDGPAQVQAALLAELDLRWQPIAGLIGALQEAAGGQA